MLPVLYHAELFLPLNRGKISMLRTGVEHGVIS